MITDPNIITSYRGLAAVLTREKVTVIIMAETQEDLEKSARWFLENESFNLMVHLCKKAVIVGDAVLPKQP